MALLMATWNHNNLKKAYLKRFHPMVFYLMIIGFQAGTPHLMERGKVLGMNKLFRLRPI
jgi:hypothetical protein